jgi:type IV secretory pathway VirD2 relaxase
MWLVGKKNFGWHLSAPAGNFSGFLILCSELLAGSLSSYAWRHAMSGDDSDLTIRPGRIRDGGAASGRKSQKLAAQVRRAAARAGLARRRPGSGKGGTGRHGRGRSAALQARFARDRRRVVIKARVVRHHGTRYRAAPLARHVAYLERDGVTKDGQDACLFDRQRDVADGDAFAERCEDDRHHFRFIVSPEDATDMRDLRAFTRELMDDMARDLGTELDWVAVDHWNTDNPHIHVLVRGRASDGTDLVIDRDYIREGMRARAEALVTLELGPRNEQEIGAALEREIDADRWTSLDRRLQRMADDADGIVDLRPGGEGGDPHQRNLLLGRATKLERLGLAERIAPATWSLSADLEPTLRDLSIRTDIIKTMHRAMGEPDRGADPTSFVLQGDAPGDPIIGRLVERGLHDELAGTAYAVIDGADGHAHHVRFRDLELTGDAAPGAIVEVRSWTDPKGGVRLSLAVRSDLTLDQQVAAPGATWLDRQLVGSEPVATGSGFGEDIRAAMKRRAEHLADEGLARRVGDRIVPDRGLLESLKNRDVAAAATRVEAVTGLPHQPSAPGEHVSGVYRERVTLASGRFAMIDDGLGFQLVPWRPSLDAHLGQHITGTMGRSGAVDWSLGRGLGR